MSLLLDMRDRARSASRFAHEAGKAERIALGRFGNQRINVTELRECIRAAALAEARALEFARVVATLERIGTAATEAVGS